MRQDHEFQTTQKEKNVKKKGSKIMEGRMVGKKEGKEGTTKRERDDGWKRNKD